MSRDVGLWIDHCKAVIITLAREGKGINSQDIEVEKQVCFSGISSQDYWAGNIQDRRFATFLSSYYARVIACFPDADTIQIFGPGEAKLQFEKYLKLVDLGKRIVGIETVEKMTNRQIEARVWKQLLS